MWQPDNDVGGTWEFNSWILLKELSLLSKSEYCWSSIDKILVFIEIAWAHGYDGPSHLSKNCSLKSN